MISNGDPYSSFNVTPLWALLPVDSPRVARAEAPEVVGQSEDGKWSVLTYMEVNSEQGMVDFVENTFWAREEGKWILKSADFSEARLSAWADARQTGAGLLAFEHQGRVWLLETVSGRIALVAAPLDFGSSADRPLHIADWAPDGSGLVLYTEGAAFWHRPATGLTAEIADIGNYGAITWSDDGKFGMLDWGTDVIRTVEIIDVGRGAVIGRLTGYAAMWSPDGEIFIAKPEPVTPAWPAGDGSSFSLVRVQIDSSVSGPSAFATFNVATGTSTAMYVPQGFGRDGALFYTQTEIQSGKEVVSWWRWDSEIEAGVRQWVEPVLVSAEPVPTLNLPDQLGGPSLARVEVSTDGRWGFFSASEVARGSGIYLIDLAADGQWERVAAGGNPRWAIGR